MSYRDSRSDSRSSSDVLRGPAGSNDRRVYVGNLPPDVRENEIKDIFEKYGDILDVDLKTRRDSHFGRGSGGSPFCFVEFQDRFAAEDAVERRDGYNYDGYKLRVEFPRGGGRGGFSRGFDRGGGGGRGRGPPRRSSYKIRVEGLPPTGSWQDLKDHMREAGEVCYADVDKNGGGVVEFVHREDMSYAIKNLDDTKFKSHENETSYIKLSKDGGRSYSRSRSRSPRRSSRRSYTRSRSRSRD